MELSNDVLEDVKKLASLAYKPREVAFTLGINVAEFIKEMKDENSEAATAYFCGFFSGEASIRENIFLTARHGSTPAQNMSTNLFNETRRDFVKQGFDFITED